MTTTHDIVSWVAGDDWQIDATLLDDKDVPFDLSIAQIKWALMNASFQRVIDEDNVTITITDAAAGKCSIRIAAAVSVTIPAARYTDAIRIVTGGITSTLSFGTISVAADPWSATEVAAVAPAPASSVTKRQYKLVA